MNIKASVRFTFKNLKFSKDEDHPNKMPFTGTLLLLDSPSDRAPHGADGHRILVPRAVAEKRLSTLVGMPLNYNDDLSDHDSQNAVGVITAAWIDGNKVEVQGVVWKKTFPDAEDDLHGQDLGMSMELADVEIDDKESDIWRLVDFYFTGATALWPGSAAYQRTALAAAAAAGLGKEGGSMPDKKQKAAAPSAALIQTIAASVATAMKDAMAPMVVAISELREDVRKLPALSAAAKAETEEERLTRELNELAASAEEGADIDAADGEDGDDIEAADDKEAEKKEDEEDEEDEEMESAATGDITDQNKDAKNQGRKTGPTQIHQSKISPAVAASATLDAMKSASSTIKTMSTRIRTLEASLQKERTQRKKERQRLDNIEKQLELSASAQSRRSVTPELMQLLEKNGIDINAAGGKKLTVAFVDKMFDTCGFSIEPHMRMAFKNQLKAAGILEERTM